MPPSSKPKKKGLIIAVVVIVLLLAIGGAVVGLAVMGKINIPGLTKKKPKVAVKPVAKPAEKPKPKPTPAPEEEAVPTPTNQVVDRAGCKKLAAVWGEMPSEALLKVITSWKAVELAPVFIELDEAKAAELLATMPAKKATETSREMRRLASIIPITE